MSFIEHPHYVVARLRHQIAGNKAVLAAYRIGHISEQGLRISRIIESEQMELEKQLRLLTEVSTKYDPNQPRVSAGNSDGGQWTDGGAGGVDPITTGATLGSASSQSGSWFQSAESVARQVNREIPLRSVLTNPALRSAAGLLSFLKTPELEYPIDQAVDQFNAIAATNSPATVAIISSRARAFTKDETNEKAWATTREADIEEVSKVCPKYFTVQTQTDIAASAAGPASRFKSPAAYGTRVHLILAEQINTMFAPALQAELVFWDGTLDHTNRNTALMPLSRERDTVNLDVYEQVGEDLVCIYDIKTGKSQLSPKRMSQLARSVAKKYPNVKNFFTIQIQPSRGAIIKGDQ